MDLGHLLFIVSNSVGSFKGQRTATIPIHMEGIVTNQLFLL